MRQCLRGDEAYAMRAHDTFMKLSRKMLLTLSGRDLSDEATYNWYIESFVLPNIFEFQRVGLDWTMIMRHRAFLLQRIKRAGPLSPWAEDDDAFVDLLVCGLFGMNTMDAMRGGGEGMLADRLRADGGTRANAMT